MNTDQKALYKSLWAEFEKVAEHYGSEHGIPEHVDEKMLAACEAPLETRGELITKARQAMEIHVLALWAKGDAAGPPTQRNLEAKAKKADSLAGMLEKRGNTEAAERQRTRAEKIRAGDRDA